MGFDLNTLWHFFWSYFEEAPETVRECPEIVLVESLSPSLSIVANTAPSVIAVLDPISTIETNQIPLASVIRSIPSQTKVRCYQ